MPATPLRAQPALQHQQQQPTIATPEQPASAQPQQQPDTGALPQVRLCSPFLKPQLHATGTAHLRELHQAGATLAETAGSSVAVHIWAFYVLKLLSVAAHL